MEKKGRLILIDLLKILFAFFVFMRHSATMGGCKYSLFSVDYLKHINGSMMSAFFIISGFSLFYVYNSKKLMNMDDTFSFYKKRAISILPIYFFVIIFHFLFIDGNIGLNFGLLPIEITGMHAFFDNTFSLLHNGTTWFVSCIIFSYFCYPLFQEIIKKLSLKSRILLFIVILLFLSYFPIMSNNYSISGMYSKPLFRNIEFVLGIILCSIIKFRDNKSKNFLYLGMFFISLLLMFFINRYRSLDFLTYLPTILMIYFASCYYTNSNKKYAIIGFMASLTYPFYILQDIVWSENIWLNQRILSINSNTLRIGSFFLFLFSLSVIIIYLYQKPLSKFLKKKLNS